MSIFQSQGPDPEPGSGNEPKQDRKVPPAEPLPEPRDS